VKPRSTPALPGSTAPASPHFSGAADAQREAVRRYPSLGFAGSPFNSAFLGRQRQYERERPEYFRDPAWPVTLAKETARALNQK